jgi:hypothetical protein
MGPGSGCRNTDGSGPRGVGTGQVRVEVGGLLAPVESDRDCGQRLCALGQLDINGCRIADFGDGALRGSLSS